MGVVINNFPEDGENPDYIRRYKGKTDPLIAVSGGYMSTGYAPASTVYAWLESRRMSIKKAIDSGKYKCIKCGRQLNHQNKGYFEDFLESSNSSLALDISSRIAGPQFAKIICDVCERNERADYRENWARSHKKHRKCQDCGIEFVPGDNDVGFDLRRYCPRCLSIRKHNNAVLVSKQVRARSATQKQHLSKLKKKKSSTKSNLQSLSEDHKRVIQLLKDRDR